MKRAVWHRGIVASAASMLAAGALSSCAPGRAVVWEGQTPDHRVAVAVHATREAQWVSVGEVRHPPFEGVSSQGVVFGPASRQLAYPAQTDRGWVVVRTDLRYPGSVSTSRVYDGIGALLFAPTGGRLAWVAERDARWLVVEEGVEGPPFDAILASSLVYSADGARLAYAARSAGAAHAVIGGSIGPAFDAIGRIALSRDGSRSAYASRTGEEAAVVIDGETGRAWPGVGQVVVSGSGEHVAFAARADQSWRVVLDGAEGPRFARIRGLHFDPLERCVYVAADSMGESVVRDGRPGPRHDSIGRVATAPDGSHWSYIAHEADGDRLVLDGKVVDHRPAIGEIVFSGDGSALGYVAEGEEEALVVVGGAEYELDLVVGGSLVLNRDGSRWACLGGVAGEERIRLVVDGTVTSRELDWSSYMDSLVSGSWRVLEDENRESYYRAWVRAEAGLVGWD